MTSSYVSGEEKYEKLPFLPKTIPYRPEDPSNHPNVAWHIGLSVFFLAPFIASGLTLAVGQWNEIIYSSGPMLLFVFFILLFGVEFALIRILGKADYLARQGEYYEYRGWRRYRDGIGKPF